MSDTGSRTNGVPLPARIEDGRSLPTISAPAVVPVQRGRCTGTVQRGRGRTIGVLLVASDGTRWQRTVDVEGLARFGIVAAAAVGVAAAVRRPSARVGPLSMGPGGWVSFRGFPAPKGERRRPWWAVLLRAHRVT
jgi:hypothetical protein